MRISPAVMFSSPAIMRSKVDLPQPDGPTRTTNSPSPIEISTPWMTLVGPKALRTSRIATEAIHSLPGQNGGLHMLLCFQRHPCRRRLDHVTGQIIVLSPSEMQGRLRDPWGASVGSPTGPGRHRRGAAAR